VRRKPVESEYLDAEGFDAFLDALGLIGDARVEFPHPNPLFDLDALLGYRVDLMASARGGITRAEVLRSAGSTPLRRPPAVEADRSSSWNGPSGSPLVLGGLRTCR
jgi:hypothetical protein